MDFLSLDNKLIKIEVDGNSDFNCIVCKAEFLSRIERNQHLETHFVHRNCEHCNKTVIIIGDLEFELHRPTHCKQFDTPAPEEAVFDETEEHLLYDENDDDNKEGVRTETDYLQIDIIEKPKRVRPKINYNEDAAEILNSIKKESSPKSQRKSRKASQKTLKSNRNEDGANNYLTDAGEYVDVVFAPKSETDDNEEDDVVKELDVALKKKRKKYAKLPKTIPCTLCDTMFATERTLKIHMSQVHKIKERFICPICQREFKIGGNLKQHIETHSDYKRFICNYCGKGFHLPYNLKEHMNTHTGARPYKCDVCGKFFGRNTLRQAHMRIHTGEKPYKCTEENCDRAYAYQTDLKRHRRSVHGIITKTFPCPICGKVFYENKFLTKHLNVHQGSA